MLGGCSSPNAILLTMTGDGSATKYAVNVYDDSSQTVIFQSGFQPIASSGALVDLTKQKLKIALKLSKTGHFKMQVLATNDEVTPNVLLFWAGHVTVNGATDVAAKVITVPSNDDLDGDFWPDANKFLNDAPAAAAVYSAHVELLDCWDDAGGEIEEPTPRPSPTGLSPSQFNPFATDICGDGYDQNCVSDGNCTDKDHDHDPATTDCDDNDPARHHATAEDPFPDPPNCCGYSLGKTGTADEHTNFLCPSTTCYAGKCTCDTLLCPMKRCGDGIDESCRGNGANMASNDTPCVIDEDCDGVDAGHDCDDHDPNAYPGAPEPCGGTKDLNCDGIVGGGCLPCDIDGDGYERNDSANNCPDKVNKHPGVFDCNDYDSGVFPTQTTYQFGNGTEASASLGRVTSAQRGNCSRHYGEVASPGPSPVPKISSFGWLVGDADCNGTAYEGCPAASCDADGDGYPDMTKTDSTTGQPCAAVDGKYDCDDTNPTIFPGAPVSCGATGTAEDCSGSPRSPCTTDADGDGWESPTDCNDGNPNVHPWAAEICDGVDNNCNGLTDEGNPDDSGNPLITGGALTQCTDYDNGVCGTEKGGCVCSQVKPVVSTGTPRTFCPGEASNSANNFPRCFGAGQPQPQSCNATNPVDDDCDGRVDAPDGKNLAVSGMPCGVSVGQCRPGTIIGCDMTKTNCFSAGNLSPNKNSPTANAWYVCSTDAVCPTAEICNGLDDDCNGSVPGMGMSAPTPAYPVTANDEVDHDGDGYMACTGCTAGALRSGLMGCNDCDDTNTTVYPGAPELCDGRNNACAAGWAASTGVSSGDDGQTTCSAQGKTCCSADQNCQDLTQVTDCKNCDNNCNATSQVADSCSPTAGCVCGNSGAACTAGNKCVGGTCRRTSGSCTAGTDCATGFCVDGVCCDSACTGSCQQCSGQGGTTKGMCSTAPAGLPVGSRTCTGESMTCGGSCNGTSAACTYPTNTIPASCNGSTYTAMGTCGSGTETGNTMTPCPTGMNCTLNDRCAMCSAPGDCASGYYCNGGACTAQNDVGGSCSTGTQCKNGQCVDGVCCGSASCGTCQSCNVAGKLGTCTDNMSSTNMCTGNGQACDANGHCRNGNGTACTTLATGTSTQCTSGNCVAKTTPATGDICCDTACAGAATCADTMTISYPSCNSGTCGMAMTTCGSGTKCQGGVCVASAAANGLACDTPSDTSAECTSMHCVANSSPGPGDVCCSAICAATVCKTGDVYSQTCSQGAGMGACSTGGTVTTDCGLYNCKSSGTGSAATAACTSSCTCSGASPCFDATECASDAYCDGAHCQAATDAICPSNTALIDCTSKPVNKKCDTPGAAAPCGT